MALDEFTQIIAANISRIMTERSMNATELAQKADLNRTAIYDIIAGRSNSPRVKTVAQIAKALSIPLSDLFLTPQQHQGQVADAYRGIESEVSDDGDRGEDVSDLRAANWLLTDIVRLTASERRMLHAQIKGILASR